MPYSVENGPDGLLYARRTGPEAPGPVARCRSCGASVVWARTQYGRWMPVDAFPATEGNVSIERQSDGALIAGVRAQTWFTLRPDVPRFTSHFATCPQAGQHRRRR